MFLIALLASAWTTSAEAAGRCHGQFVRVSAGHAPSYDPFSAQDSRQEYKLVVRNRGPFPCAFDIELSPKVLPLAFGRKLRFDLVSDKGALSFPSDVHFSTPTIQPGQELSIPLAVIVPRGQFVGPGKYDAEFLVILRNRFRRGRNPWPDDRAQVRLACRVASILSVNLGGAGIATVIDFGELRSHDRRSVVLNVRSNQHYRVKLASENSGHLRLASAAGAQETIPYSLLVDGSPVDLTRPQELGMGHKQLVEEIQHRLTVEIGDIAETQEAGVYRDVISVNLEAQP